MENEQGHPLLEKVNTLQDKFKDPAYADDLEKIKSWKEALKDLIDREELFQNKKLQEILLKYKNDVVDMNTKILNNDSKTLGDYDRDRLLDKKKLYLEFIDTFNLDSIREALKSVDNEISDELASLVS